jgi:L-ornithine N5-oxygenase
LSGTLLSVLALRSDEIVASLAEHAARDRPASRITPQQKNGMSDGRMAIGL